jgi:tRNA G18 (ribose-2'-O)-methylase SpoU
MTRIESADDPRLSLYIAMKDRDIRRETGLFLAEGEALLRRACEAGLRVRSVLVVERKADRVRAMLDEIGRGEFAIERLVCDEALIASAVGFAMHRGVIAAVEPSAVLKGSEGLDEAVAQAMAADRPILLVCPEIADAENLGLLLRTAAGLGVGAVVLGPRCVDPWYRRVVRVSMGAVFTLPIVTLDVADGLNRLATRYNYECIATVIDPNATPLHDALVSPQQRYAILVGSEGYGLPLHLVHQCDQRVRIPMREGIDSLNVAVAAGIIVNHYATGSRGMKN